MTYHIIKHRYHGHALHNDAIFMLERMIVAKGYELDDNVKAFSQLKINSEPDIVFKVREKATDEKGRKYKDEFVRYVIEVETHPSAASVAKKREQYEKQCRGVRLIIVDLEMCKNTDSRTELESFLEPYIP